MATVESYQGESIDCFKERPKTVLTVVLADGKGNLLGLNVDASLPRNKLKEFSEKANKVYQSNYPPVLKQKKIKKLL